jgi:uncharacterized membrane protein
MSTRYINVVAVVAFVAEVAVAIYLTVVAWLMSGWFVDDSWAARASNADWIKTAVVRFLACFIVGVIAGLGAWGLNRWLAAKGARIPKMVPAVSGGILGTSIVVASAIGSIQFLIDRPWL